MSSVSPQKGKGFFQNLKKGVLNIFSGRRTIRKKLMRPIKISNENEARKKTLKRKQIRSKKEEGELSVLEGRIAAPEYEYMGNQYRAMRNRPAIQKYFNRFYPRNDPLNSALEQYSPQILGVYQHPEDARAELNEDALNIADEAIADPTYTEGIDDISKGYVLDDPERTPYIYETQAEVELRTLPAMFALWYEKKTGAESPYMTIQEIPDELFEEMVNEMKQIDSVEETCIELFGMRERELTKFIEEHEIGKEEERVATKEIGGKQKKFLTKLVERDILQPNGSVRREIRISVGGAISPGRYFATMKEGKKYIIYHTDFDINRCATVLPEDIPNFRPLTSIKSSGCLTIFKGKENVLRYMKQKVPSMMFFKNWIVLRKEFVPFGSSFERVFAGKFFSLSFIQDALENWGLIGMDPSFFILCRVKYPLVLLKNSTFVVKSTEFQRFYEDIFRNDNRENFCILDKKFYGGKYELMLDNPFVESDDNDMFETFYKAADQGFLYGMTPYMAYMMKKLNPSMWFLFLTGSPDMKKQSEVFENFQIYKGLSTREKIIVDYLQFIRFLEVLQDEYNFKKARDTYKDLLSDERIKSELLELYTEENPNNIEMMQYIQTLVTPQMREGEPDVLYMRKNQIKTILDKFKLSLRIRAPVIANNENNANFYARPRVSEPAALTLRRPEQPVFDRVAHLQSQLMLLKNERNSLLRNKSIYNATTKKRRNRAELNKRYKQMAKLARTRQQKEELEVKRSLAQAKFQRLNVLNQKIRQLEQLLPKPPTAAGTGLLPASTGSSAHTSSSNGVPFPELPAAATVA